MVRTVHGKLDFRKFDEELKLVDGLAIKFDEHFSVVRIALPRGASLVNYMARRTLCL